MKEEEEGAIEELEEEDSEVGKVEEEGEKEEEEKEEDSEQEGEKIDQEQKEEVEEDSAEEAEVEVVKQVEHHKLLQQLKNEIHSRFLPQKYPKNPDNYNLLQNYNYMEFCF